LAVTVLRLSDLHGAAWFVLHNWYNRLLGRQPRPVDGSRWSQRELRHARWYAPLLLAGYAISTGTLVVAMIPAAARVLSLIYRRLVDPGQAGAGAVADAAVFLLLNLVQLAVVAVLARRARRPAQAGGSS
jgi:hypothetical protein